MALSQIYVDPSIAGNSGTGVIGDPYGDLTYALQQETWDSVNGMQFNIKAGTDEVLATELATTLTAQSYSPAEAAPLVFRGYTAAADDGGIGGISGGGSVAIINSSTLDYVYFIDLHLHNTGSAAVITLDDFCGVYNCEVDNSTGNGIVANSNSDILSNHVHNIGGVGISNGDRALIGYNRLVNGTNDFSTAILPNASGGSTVFRNIIDIDGASNGISAIEGLKIMNNSIYSNGGTGSGIVGVANQICGVISNNLIEGFSGSGGYGIEMNVAGAGVRVYGGNSVYDCETEFGTPTRYTLYSLGGNETLSASPFTAPATDDFRPVDTGSVKEGSLPAAVA